MNLRDSHHTPAPDDVSCLQNSLMTRGLDQVGYISLGRLQSQDNTALLSFSNSASSSWLNWEFEQTN